MNTVFAITLASIFAIGLTACSEENPQQSAESTSDIEQASQEARDPKVPYVDKATGVVYDPEEVKLPEQPVSTAFESFYIVDDGLDLSKVYLTFTDVATSNTPVAIKMLNQVDNEKIMSLIVKYENTQDKFVINDTLAEIRPLILDYMKSNAGSRDITFETNIRLSSYNFDTNAFKNIDDIFNPVTVGSSLKGLSRNAKDEVIRSDIYWDDSTHLRLNINNSQDFSDIIVKDQAVARIIESKVASSGAVKARVYGQVVSTTAETPVNGKTNDEKYVVIKAQMIRFIDENTGKTILDYAI